MQQQFNLYSYKYKKYYFLLIFCFVFLSKGISQTESRERKYSIYADIGLNYYFEKRFIEPQASTPASVHIYDAFTKYSGPGYQLGLLTDVLNRNSKIKLKTGLILFVEKSFYKTDSLTLLIYNRYYPNFVTTIYSTQYFLEIPFLINIPLISHISFNGGFKIPVIQKSREKMTNVHNNERTYSWTSYYVVLNRWPLTASIEYTYRNQKKLSSYFGIDYRDYKQYFFQLGFRYKIS